MKRLMPNLGLAVILTAAVALVAACGSSPSTTGAPVSSPSTAGAPVDVVASTDVWGSIVSAVGGTQVRVTSIISDPSADPHSYEASARNQLAISRAALIVENGGGYDDFVNRMISSSGSKAIVVNAVDVSGYAAVSGAALNEHVWYDFPTVDKVVAAIRAALASADPANSGVFSANAASFTDKVAALRQKEASIKARSAGTGVAITEPLPLYLLTASGLVNRTPTAFSDAIENDSDAPAAAVEQTLALFSDKKVKALVYNAQTTGPQTQLVRSAARNNGIAEVPVTETLPSGTDYLSWMNANLDAVAKAVS